jgi:acetoin utilization protein AcuB
MKHMPQIVAMMTPFPYSIDIGAPLAEARAFMAKQHIRHLPVIENGKLAGMVTDRDIKLMLGPDFAYPQERELAVRDACVPDPYIVAASAPVDEVAEEMAKRHIGSALVTRDGKLVGVFTSTDACHALARVLRERFPPPPRPEEAA